MTTLTQWRAPFQVNTGDAGIGNQFAPEIIGLANGWFMVAWREQGDGGAPGNGQDIVAKIYDADGNVEFDSFALNFEWTEGDQTAFDIAPTHDGFVVVYSDYDFPNKTLRIERNFDDLTYVFGTLTNAGNFNSPQIAANLLPENDDIFIVYEDGKRGGLYGRVVDENDNFSPVRPALRPAGNGVQARVDDTVVLSNGNFASLVWTGGGNLVSVVAADGTFLKKTSVVYSPSFARDIASLADGGYVVVGKAGSRFGEIFARVYNNASNFVTEIIPIEIQGYVVNDCPSSGFLEPMAA